MLLRSEKVLKHEMMDYQYRRGFYEYCKNKNATITPEASADGQKTIIPTTTDTPNRNWKIKEGHIQKLQQQYNGGANTAKSQYARITANEEVDRFSSLKEATETAAIPQSIKNIFLLGEKAFNDAKKAAIARGMESLMNEADQRVTYEKYKLQCEGYLNDNVAKEQIDAASAQGEASAPLPHDASAARHFLKPLS